MKKAIAALDKLFTDTKLHRRGEPATDAQIRAAERVLGHPLPRDLATLYRHVNGFALYCGTDPGTSDGSPFRLFTLDELHALASGVGWTPPSDLADTGWAEHPARIRAFGLPNGDFVSWIALPDASVRWIDDWRERPKLLVLPLAKLLERAAAPSAFDGKQWSANSIRDHATPSKRAYEDYPGSPAHFRVEVALKHEDYDHALALARNGRKADEAFRTLCDVLVLEVLARAGDLAELGREVEVLRKIWSSGKRSFIHMDLWRRVDEIVTGAIPDHPDLGWVRAERAAAATDDFM